MDAGVTRRGTSHKLFFRERIRDGAIRVAKDGRKRRQRLARLMAGLDQRREDEERRWREYGRDGRFKQTNLA